MSCLVNLSFGIKYGNPIIINTVVNKISSILLDTFTGNIITGSNNKVMYWDQNGTLVNHILIKNADIGGIAISEQTRKLVVNCIDHIRIYEENTTLFNSFNVSNINDDIIIDDIHNVIITFKFINDNSSSIIYYDFNGIILSNYTVDCIIWDTIINKNNGNIIFDNYIWNYPRAFIYIANMNGVHTKINTNKMYPASGLNLDRFNNIIVGEYGIDMYSSKGSFIRHLKLNNYVVFSPIVYLKYNYIIYVDLFSGPKPFIQFIDEYGNCILNIYDEQQITNILIDQQTGTLVANFGNQIKIWRQI